MAEDKRKKNRKIATAVGAVAGGALLFWSARYTYNQLYRWYYKLPPGPVFAIPFIGSVLYRILNPHRWHTTWAIHFGPIVSYSEFNRLTILINDSKIAKQVLSKQNTLDRNFPDWMVRESPLEIDSGMFILRDGAIWMKLRKYMHTQLVRVMNTKYVNEIMRDAIRDELEPYLSALVSASDNKSVWFSRQHLSQLTFNIIFRANFGENVAFQNNKLCTQLAKDLVDIVAFEMNKRRTLKVFLPLFSKLFVPKSYFQPYVDMKQRLNDAIKQLQRNASSRSRTANQASSDDTTFMDQTRQLTEMADNDYTEAQQMADVFLMFVAGTDTTSVSTEWGLLLLGRQTDIQDKVRGELMHVLQKNGIDYQSNAFDIAYDIQLLLQLPLFRALIHEILRISCVARTGVPHSVSNDDIWITCDDGIRYRLPKGSFLMYNVECMHYDYLNREHWKNAQFGLNHEHICLENWIEKESGKFVQNESFMTFGYGKRDCVGKQLAMKEMRVILGYLLLNYKFTLSKEYESMARIPSVGGVLGGVAKPTSDSKNGTTEIPVMIEKI